MRLRIPFFLLPVEVRFNGFPGLYSFLFVKMISGSVVKMAERLRCALSRLRARGTRRICQHRSTRRPLWRWCLWRWSAGWLPAMAAAAPATWT